MLKMPFMIGGLLVAVPSLIAGPRSENTQCGAPAYKVPQTYSRTPESIAFAVSVKPRDATVQNLFALACQLRLDYSVEQQVSANIFNDEQAAKYTTVPTMVAVENPKRSNPAAYLASYHLDRQKGVETLTLVVNPKNPCGNDIQIDLKTKRVGIVSSASAAAANPHAENNPCDAPKYQVSLVYSQTSEQTALAVSIKPRDVTLKNLLGLACQLRSDYPNGSIVLADIFNDHNAAKHTSIHGVENPKRSNEGAYIGYYRLDRHKGIETLTLAVDVNHPCGNDIEIDLVNKKASVLTCN